MNIHFLEFYSDYKLLALYYVFNLFFIIKLETMLQNIWQLITMEHKAIMSRLKKFKNFQIRLFKCKTFKMPPRFFKCISCQDAMKKICSLFLMQPNIHSNWSFTSIAHACCWNLRSLSFLVYTLLTSWGFKFKAVI